MLYHLTPLETMDLNYVAGENRVSNGVDEVS